MDDDEESDSLLKETEDDRVRLAELQKAKQNKDKDVSFISTEKFNAPHLFSFSNLSPIWCFQY